LGLVEPLAQFSALTTEFVRFPGMWGHPNEAGHMAALTTVAASFLYVRRKSALAVVLSLVAVVGTFLFTANRGGVIASAIIVATASVFGPDLKARNFGRLAIIICAVVMLGIASVWTSSDVY